MPDTGESPPAAFRPHFDPAGYSWWREPLRVPGQPRRLLEADELPSALFDRLSRQQRWGLSYVGYETQAAAYADLAAAWGALDAAERAACGLWVAANLLRCEL